MPHTAMEATTPAAQSPNQITMGGLLDAFEVLQGLAEQSLEGATAAKIVRLNRWAHPYYLRAIAARAIEAEKYGEKLGEGKFRIPAEKMAEFNLAMVPLRAEPIELDPSLRLDLHAISSAMVTPAALERLEPFMVGL